VEGCLARQPGRDRGAPAGYIKKGQAELKMRNRTAYHDRGLVFAKEWGSRTLPGGSALCSMAEPQSRHPG
jgi:hypothetical protein